MNKFLLKNVAPVTVDLPKEKPEITYLISGYSVTVNPEKLSKEDSELFPYLAIRQLLNSPVLSKQEYDYLNNSVLLSPHESYDKLFCKAQHLDSDKKVTTDPYEFRYLKLSFVFYPFDWVGKSHKVRFCRDKEVQKVKRKMFLANKIKACTRVGYWKLKKGK